MYATNLLQTFTPTKSPVQPGRRKPFSEIPANACRGAVRFQAPCGGEGGSSAPGPGDWDYEADFLRKNAAKAVIPRSARWPKAVDMTPGPGAYTPNENAVRSQPPAQSIARALSAAHPTIPGGYYDPAHFSRRTNPPAAVPSLHTPGPLDYASTDVFSRPKSPGATFGFHRDYIAPKLFAAPVSPNQPTSQPTNRPRSTSPASQLARQRKAWRAARDLSPSTPQRNVTSDQYSSQVPLVPYALTPDRPRSERQAVSVADARAGEGDDGIFAAVQQAAIQLFKNSDRKAVIPAQPERCPVKTTKPAVERQRIPLQSNVFVPVGASTVARQQPPEIAYSEDTSAAPTPATTSSTPGPPPGQAVSVPRFVATNEEEGGVYNPSPALQQIRQLRSTPAPSGTGAPKASSAVRHATPSPAKTLRSSETAGYMTQWCSTPSRPSSAASAATLPARVRGIKPAVPRQTTPQPVRKLSLLLRSPGNGTRPRSTPRARSRNFAADDTPGPGQYHQDKIGAIGSRRNSGPRRQTPPMPVRARRQVTEEDYPGPGEYETGLRFGGGRSALFGTSPRDTFKSLRNKW